MLRELGVCFFPFASLLFWKLSFLASTSRAGSKNCFSTGVGFWLYVPLCEVVSPFRLVHV